MLRPSTRRLSSKSRFHCGTNASGVPGVPGVPGDPGELGPPGAMGVSAMVQHGGLVRGWALAGCRARAGTGRAWLALTARVATRA